mgnify:CR=1 FL=1
MSSQLRVDKILPVDGAPTGGGGGVVQVQMGVTATQSTTTSGSFDATALSASITPKFNTSKIFVMVTLGFVSSDGGISVGFRLLRGSTLIGNASDTTLQSGFTNIYVGGHSDDKYLQSVAFNFLDSPATTSTVTYKLQVSSWVGRDFYLNRSQQDSGAAWTHGASSSMTAMEVSA